MSNKELNKDLLMEVKNLLECNKIDSNYMSENDSDAAMASCPNCIACTCMICV